MPLFNRKKKQPSSTEGTTEKKAGWRRPANTAFKQQRLKAWQPILTPKTVLPTLFIIGLVFAPIGTVLIWASSLISEMTFDYTDCQTLTPSTNDSLSFTPLPSNKYSYRLRNGNGDVPIQPPRYAYLDNRGNSAFDVSNQEQCIVEFHVPINLDPSIFLYYKLTNFYQNHRRYVKSQNGDQLIGDYVSPDDLDDSDCDPLGSIDGVAIYPCGLIANSLFNDTFYTPFLQNDNNSSDQEPVPYTFTDKGIAWNGEQNKYTENPVSSRGYSDYNQIVPPPNWRLRYPDGYNESNIPNLREDEHFQNWMRTAGLPTFTKLYGRNDNDVLREGIYRIVIGLNFPVVNYKGTKSFVVSTVSWIGGKNPFLGWAYIASSALFILLATLGTARHLIRPRRLGDMSLLSWNR
ncbi:hypothetical protein AGABI1DRAFT_111436 [Agaricus bisporus var. burnettii JB137-S8]|uniref:Cell cycle control protein n=2 Tax=Agaricus bisporus var. burnettii TaxID=192524 RepID=K5XHD8_AGABU|nr:hypothetical protein AGABI2DRAFT_190658 [Agaricus bisporus var. bisporus H97]XP_007326766.1 uncharacterized protein AGABI1DRAFT_111436 [Agaricus bisporus var. burnettii JB137-S8]EKM82873.1 hypothetical protein AGABI1DRAFT_111436 [Agaricus bisporus var. burnettii JB137-S8]EKV50272.1 hypothetical protein AGABI2DRAFT_190658 [Agaricus bisporus var. bisporus H97]KAF7778904.1 hypothetical protein Agabi119p4_3249 [Agaricus bisporus var. burnettii]